MLRTAYWYTHFATSVIGTIPHMIKVNLLEKKGTAAERYEYIHSFTSKWAMTHIKASGARVTVHGIENIPTDGPVVFISNHQGNFDIALFMAFIDKPKGYISKIEMKKIPLINKWMKWMECIFMDRSSLRKSAEAIVEGVKTIKNGHSLVIFPEGTRSRCNKLGEFKTGSFKLATKSKVPIVPVTINGSYKLMEETGHVKPADVEIFIHEPIPTLNLTKEELDKLPSNVVSIIASKL